MPGSSTGWGCRMSESLHEEVIRVARDLIRLDTTNAREPGLGNETLCAEYLADYLSGYGVECELVAREDHRANLVARIPGGSRQARPAHARSRWRSSGTPTWCRATRATGRTRRSRPSSTTTAGCGAEARST